MPTPNAKKSLGQHFLQDTNIAQKIVASLQSNDCPAIEIGPGRGVLTQFLVLRPFPQLYLVEVDQGLAQHLKDSYTASHVHVLADDFLKLALDELQEDELVVVGNFPYNISSPIFFKLLSYRQQVKEVVCMIQKEVAARITTQPGSKVYGLLSVLLQAFYEVEYLFTVGPQVFSPPPKVQSAVIRLKRRNCIKLACDEALFFSVVKMAFQQRRKTLRNALKSMLNESIDVHQAIWSQRAEQLAVEDFVFLTRLIGSSSEA